MSPTASSWITHSPIRMSFPWHTYTSTLSKCQGSNGRMTAVPSRKDTARRVESCRSKTLSHVGRFRAVPQLACFRWQPFPGGLIWVGENEIRMRIEKLRHRHRPKWELIVNSTTLVGNHSAHLWSPYPTKPCGNSVDEVLSHKRGGPHLPSNQQLTAVPPISGRLHWTIDIHQV